MMGIIGGFGVFIILLELGLAKEPGSHSAMEFWLSSVVICIIVSAFSRV